MHSRIFDPCSGKQRGCRDTEYLPPPLTPPLKGEGKAPGNPLTLPSPIGCLRVQVLKTFIPLPLRGGVRGGGKDSGVKRFQFRSLAPHHLSPTVKTR